MPDIVDSLQRGIGDKNDLSIQAVILDMDGVLWRGPQPIGDLPAIWDRFERRGWKVALATNNATQTRAQYVDKLSNFGVEIDRSQVVTSAIATGHYLGQRYPGGGRVFMLGEEGLARALASRGFAHADDEVLAVVSSMDRSLTFEKLRRATLLIRAGVAFIATNADRTFPTPEGLIPGAGSILAALEAATGRQAAIMGKPQPEMYRTAMEILGSSPETTLVVGDRLETDIAGGQRLGCVTALVLSGVTSPEAGKAWRPAPDFIADDLSALLNILL